MPFPPLSRKEALEALTLRRAQMRILIANGWQRRDNSKLIAGSPMYYYCEFCGYEICVPESYPWHVRRCRDCEYLKEKGWLPDAELGEDARGA